MLITDIEESYRVFLCFVKLQKSRFRSQSLFSQLTQNTCCYMHIASPPISSSLHPPATNSYVVTAALLVTALKLQYLLYIVIELILG